MNKRLAILALAGAVAFCADESLAQTMKKLTPGQLEGVCAREARADHLPTTGKVYDDFMRKCEGSSPAAAPLPPASQPPGAAPLQPHPTPPLSPRERSCYEKIAEMGVKGALAKAELARCLGAH
jgi:hypothetical protein